MAKISDLADAGVLDGTEQVPVVRGGSTFKTLLSSLISSVVGPFINAAQAHQVDDLIRHSGGDLGDRIVMFGTLTPDGTGIAELLSIRKRDGMLLGSFQPSPDQAASFIDNILVYAADAGDLDVRAATVAADGQCYVLSGFRKSTGRYLASLEDMTVGPIDAAFADARARLLALESGSSSTDNIAYVSGGQLRVIDAAGARTLDNDPAKTWISARIAGASVLGVFSNGAVDQLTRVSLSTGRNWPAAEITIISDDGQSNGEAEAEELAAALRTIYPYSSKLRMLATTGLNVWADQATVGGASLQLDPASITGFTALRGKLIDATHGTTSAESAAYRYAQRADAETGWVPDILVLNNCEGGQTIENLSEGAPAGYHGMSNVVTKLNRIATFAAAEGKRAVWRYIIMTQGESNSGDLTLGLKHDTYRSQVEAKAQAILGQTAPLRMLSWQMSSFYANSNGAQSILAHHLTNPAKLRCLGPAYAFPMSAALLHHSSLGHDQMGEYAEMAVAEWDRTGTFKPLRMISASRTGANQITVIMSEPVAIDTARVPAKANYGVQTPGATIAGVTVSGNQIVIATTNAASGATSVDIALEGHVTANGRQAATQARSNIRTAASFGDYRDGSLIHKFACHQRITL